MSQAGTCNNGVFPPGTVVQTITGNTGGPVGPDGANNIDLVTQNTTVDVAGIPVSNLLTINFGIDNLILGTDASSITVGVRNVGLGLNALNALTAGVNNTAIGYQAGQLLTSGGNNTFLGYVAGASVTGGNNTYIGAASGAGGSAAQNTFIGASSAASNGATANVALG